MYPHTCHFCHLFYSVIHTAFIPWENRTFLSLFGFSCFSISVNSWRNSSHRLSVTHSRPVSSTWLKQSGSRNLSTVFVWPIVRNCTSLLWFSSLSRYAWINRLHRHPPWSNWTTVVTCLRISIFIWFLTASSLSSDSLPHLIWFYGSISSRVKVVGHPPPPWDLVALGHVPSTTLMPQARHKKFNYFH